MRAVQYLRLAGENALQWSAHQEAVGHFTTALELLAALPERPERAQQELEVRLALGPALMVTKGNAAPEVEQTYARAQALCQPIGETPLRAPRCLRFGTTCFPWPIPATTVPLMSIHQSASSHE